MKIKKYRIINEREVPLSSECPKCNRENSVCYTTSNSPFDKYCNKCGINFRQETEKIIELQRVK